MSNKYELREQRINTRINEISKMQDKQLSKVVDLIKSTLEDEFEGTTVQKRNQWLLQDIVEDLRNSYPDVEFFNYHDRSSMRPDGGILVLESMEGEQYPILISEKKNQGTNDIRETEGMPKQAKGNAIERLGKNVIGFRAAMLKESIFPFVCFGDGCDFK